MDVIRSLLLFFDEYPYWVRYAVVIWILATAAVLGILVLARQAENAEGSNIHGKNATSMSMVDSYYGAIETGLFSPLDCQRHRVASHRELITIENSACEALSELRSNMKLLAQYREAATAKAKNLPDGSFKYSKVSHFFDLFFKELPQGPYKRHFLSLIERMAQSGTELVSFRAVSQLHQWNASGRMTIDDLLIGNSFLDWAIGTEIKDRISVSELVRLGPFYEMSFGPEMQSLVTTREFREESGKPMDFSYIVGLYD
jgi:hypothetical protein